MNLTKRLERLEAQVRAQNGEDDSSLCRELIYDPRDCGLDHKRDCASYRASRRSAEA